MQYLRSVLAQDESITASDVKTYDLPVNPLSFIMCTVIGKQSAANTLISIDDLINVIDRIEVLFKGSSVISIDNIKDLLFMQCMINKMLPLVENWGNANNQRIAVSLIIPFGKRLYDPNECFPASRRGELQLRLEYASSLGDLASAVMQIETVELLDAAPKRFIKITDFSKTPSAVGDVDMDLPIGNKIMGIGLYSTTVPSGSAATTTIDKVELLIDNVETYFTQANWESLHAEISRRLPPARLDLTHRHTENLAGSYTQNANTAYATFPNTLFNNYAYMDFDPLHDDQFLLETAGKSRVHLRVSAGDTNEIRMLPVEIIELGAE